ncbi:MAG: hypothetical protein ACOX6J_03795 [Oscillospiraceae bacterium]|jgi:hypothetical protein
MNTENIYRGPERSSEVSRRKEARSFGTRTAVKYLAVSVFCFIFSTVYGLFSHGVSSDWMSKAFLIPLGAAAMYFIVNTVFAAPEPGDLARCLIGSGVASCTMSCILKGVFEIAGNSSPYQVWMRYAGIAMLAGGIAAAAFTYIGSGKHKADGQS